MLENRRSQALLCMTQAAVALRPAADVAVPGADEGSDNESSSELEWRQEWDTDSRWRPWAVHPDPVGMPCQYLLLLIITMYCSPLQQWEF